MTSEVVESSKDEIECKNYNEPELVAIASLSKVLENYK